MPVDDIRQPYQMQWKLNKCTLRSAIDYIMSINVCNRLTAVVFIFTVVDTVTYAVANSGTVDAAWVFTSKLCVSTTSGSWTWKAQYQKRKNIFWNYSRIVKSNKEDGFKQIMRNVHTKNIVRYKSRYTPQVIRINTTSKDTVDCYWAIPDFTSL